MAVIKVRQDRPIGLCKDCREAHITRDDMGEEEIICQIIFHAPQRITRPIMWCNDHNSNSMNRYDMEKVAWVVSTDKSGQVVGFAPPKPEKD